MTLHGQLTDCILLYSYSIEQSVQDVDSILRALGYKKFHILGHSYGGCLAFVSLFCC